MSVSSVNPGIGSNQFAQAAMKNALPQRVGTQAALASGKTDVRPVMQAALESAAPAVGIPTLHANRVGVAAYAAIMNPQALTSMRIEA